MTTMAVLEPTRRRAGIIAGAVALATAFAIAATPSPARAQGAPLGGFAAAATPSRFELGAKPGEVVSRAIELQHVGSGNTEYRLRSADWDLSEARGLEFFDDLQPGSCRPWLRLERRSVTLAPNVRRKIRFEVHVPPDAPRGECRFAVLIEGGDGRDVNLADGGSVRLPVTGRLGIIVYVAVGGAEPKLELVDVTSVEDNGLRTPAVVVRNSGDAHGRLDGAVQGDDANGRRLQFPVSTLPILPGQTRKLVLTPAENLISKRRPDVAYPVKLSGQLDWDAGRFDVDREVR